MSPAIGTSGETPGLASPVAAVLFGGWDGHVRGGSDATTCERQVVAARRWRLLVGQQPTSRNRIKSAGAPGRHPGPQFFRTREAQANASS